MHDDLIFVNVVIADALDVFDLDLVPGNVVDLPRLVIDEVMVPLEFGIEDHGILGQMQLAQQTLLDEQIERVVDRGARDHRKSIADAVPHAIGGWMIVRSQDILCDCHAMRRGLNPVFGEDFDDVDAQCVA